MRQALPQTTVYLKVNLLREHYVIVDFPGEVKMIQC